MNFDEDTIYTICDTMMRANQFHCLDTLIRYVAPKTTDINSILAWLCATLPAKHRLSSRGVMISALIQHPGFTAVLLKGLE